MPAPNSSSRAVADGGGRRRRRYSASASAASQVRSPVVPRPEISEGVSRTVMGASGGGSVYVTATFSVGKGAGGRHEASRSV